MPKEGDPTGRPRSATSPFIRSPKPPERETVEEGSGLIAMHRHRDPLDELRVEIAQLKKWREQHVRDHHELDKQLLEQNHVNEMTNDRLKAGAESFSKVTAALDVTKKSIEDLATAISPKPMSGGKVAMIVVGLITGIGSAVAGVIWQAAKYPDRVEFNEQKTVIDNVSAQQGAMNAKINTTEQAIQRIEKAQEKIDEKIDKLGTRRGR